MLRAGVRGEDSIPAAADRAGCFRLVLFPGDLRHVHASMHTLCVKSWLIRKNVCVAECEILAVLCFEILAVL